MKTSKSKKAFLLAGVCLICGGVLVAVLSNSTHAKVETSGISTEASSKADDVSVSPILVVDEDRSGTSPANGTGSAAFDPAKEESRSEPLTVISKPTSQPPKPVVEGDSKDGKQPTNSALTDKTKKPTYTSKPTVTSKPKPSSSSKSGGSTGTAGGDPIFGNSHGTGGEMTKIDGDGDINKQVGIMD